MMVSTGTNCSRRVRRYQALIPAPCSVWAVEPMIWLVGAKIMDGEPPAKCALHLMHSLLLSLQTGMEVTRHEQECIQV